MKAKTLGARGKRAAGKAIAKVEGTVMKAVGRKVVRSKLSTAGKAAATVGRAAVKAGLIAGATAAAGMILDRRRRKAR
jgi:hypothetical protein